jgi:catechol 1,2-dioxygenase
MSKPPRNEMLLLADILGLETLADSISSSLLTSSSSLATASALLGPFYRPNAPFCAMGSSILLSPTPECQPALLHGRVLDYATSGPITNAVLDVWLTGPDGTYEGQDPAGGIHAEGNLRGRFKTGEDGVYEIYAIKPTSYPIPVDGPAGRVLRMLDRGEWRPAHVHFLVSVEQDILRMREKR